MTTVVNSSPLIKLAAIDSLDLLKSLFEVIHIPKAVHREVVVFGKGRPGAKAVAGAFWIKRHTVKDQRAVLDLMAVARLDQGESEAIILAAELKADILIIDDARAREYARTLQLRIVGTAGLLLSAKALKIIPSVQQPLDALVSAGLYLDPRTYRAILKKAGEK